MNDIREHLLRRDYLYSDASAYRAGVEAALAALTDKQGRVDAPTADADHTQAIAIAVASGHA
ncbi:hypothetical protein BH23ACT9_BH23ACT9_34020 [soil metagenome]